MARGIISKAIWANVYSSSKLFKALRTAVAHAKSAQDSLNFTIDMVDDAKKEVKKLKRRVKKLRKIRIHDRESLDVAIGLVNENPPFRGTLELSSGLTKSLRRKLVKKATAAIVVLLPPAVV